MLILGIESSCDETSAAIISGDHKSNNVKLISSAVASSLSLHSKTGGIIPESAAREQVKFIIPVIHKALEEAKLNAKDIDAIAVTYGPGLIGSLLIGVETAKTLSMIWDKPLIPTNHLLGHIYANFIDEQSKIQFPAIGLVVSGGHTDLIIIRNHGNIEWLGGTRDDAAGEALDKVGRLLDLPYPGGPYIEKLAREGDQKKYIFPRPLIGSGDFDFSFSGLKTAVHREIKLINKLTEQNKKDISAGVQNAVIDIIIRKTLKAVKKYNAKSLLLGGGVTANSKLTQEFENRLTKSGIHAKLFVPPKNLCTDNGAMIASAAFYNDKRVNFRTVNANPSLYFD